VSASERRKVPIDQMTAAALALDQRTLPGWWREHGPTPEQRAPLEALWRRAYYVAVVAGALLPIVERSKEPT
jgi:hypothetical protein